MNINKALLAMALGFALAAAPQDDDKQPACDSPDEEKDAAPAATPTDGGEGK